MNGEHNVGFEVEPMARLEVGHEQTGVRRATVLVRTGRHSYLGTLCVPDGEARVLDVLGDRRAFLNLTDVSTDGAGALEPLLVVDKSAIHCLRFVGVPTLHASGLGTEDAR